MPTSFRLICCDRPRGKNPGGGTAVSTQILHAPLDTANISPASRYIRETRDVLLTYETEELAALRFSIILTARWEASNDEDAERRAELRDELALLRMHYGDKVDEIAMTYGIQQAMKTKEEVERTVIVPREMKPIAMPGDNGECDGGECGL
jgi:hypothetical protein